MRIRFAAALVFFSLVISTACQETEKPATAPTMPTVDVANSAIERRAVEAVIWGMPIVNYDRMYQAVVQQTHGDFNQIVCWSRLPSWKNQKIPRIIPPGEST
jgi:hypothetical protein